MLTGSVVDVHLFAVLLILLAGFFALSGGKTFRSAVKLMGGWSLSLLVGALCALIVLAIGANGVRFNRSQISHRL